MDTISVGNKRTNISIGGRSSIGDIYSCAGDETDNTDAVTIKGEISGDALSTATRIRRYNDKRNTKTSRSDVKLIIIVLSVLAIIVIVIVISVYLYKSKGNVAETSLTTETDEISESEITRPPTSSSQKSKSKVPTNSS